ncbi:MAG TPA: hypothetical protein VFK15_16960, partial [Burkholderiales bacterium]|nr:hypothetical protein [Burkholderiales bacterium]
RVRGLSITRMLVRRCDRPLTPAMSELMRIAMENLGELRCAGFFDAKVLKSKLPRVREALKA